MLIHGPTKSKVLKRVSYYIRPIGIQINLTDLCKSLSFGGVGGIITASTFIRKESLSISKL